MTPVSLLASKAFQAFVMLLVAIAVVTTLLVTGNIDRQSGTNVLYALLGLGVGIPLNTGTPSSTT
jgi:hypothetical protein